MQFNAGTCTPVENMESDMPNNEVQKLVESLDTFQEVRFVNTLIQGLCARTASNELGGNEARGLMVVLEWQNEKLKGAEAIVQTVLNKQAALVRVA
jgi:hypothetical protein